jgi:hypothetical protein
MDRASTTTGPQRDNSGKKHEVRRRGTDRRSPPALRAVIFEKRRSPQAREAVRDVKRFVLAAYAFVAAGSHRLRPASRQGSQAADPRAARDRRHEGEGQDHCAWNQGQQAKGALKGNVTRVIATSITPPSPSHAAPPAAHRPRLPRPCPSPHPRGVTGRLPILFSDLIVCRRPRLDPVWRRTCSRPVR